MNSARLSLSPAENIYEIYLKIGDSDSPGQKPFPVQKLGPGTDFP